MPIKKYKPTTPGRRFGSVADFAEITKTEPEKSLLRPKKRTGGRNNAGRLTMRHQGGGHKQRYRVIDFKRDKIGVPGKVAAIEYDPNRSARIALIFYHDGEKRYILAPLNLPSTMPLHASLLFSRNLTSFIQAFTKDNAFRVDLTDDIQQASVITHEGAVKHQRTQDALQKVAP